MTPTLMSDSSILSRMLWAGLVSLAAVGVAAVRQEVVQSRACYHGDDGGDIYGFEHTDVYNNRTISLSEFKGKVSVIPSFFFM